MTRAALGYPMNHSPDWCNSAGTGLVLSGGGARGAYEVGVLRFVLSCLKKEGISPHFDFLSGTSVGALNCAFLASHADDQSAAALQLVDYWRSMRMDTLLKFGPRELGDLVYVLLGSAGALGKLMRRKRKKLPWGANAHHEPIHGLFDTTPFAEDMSRRIPWRRIGENLKNGCLKGVAVAATEVCRGKTVVFYQMGEGKGFEFGADPSKEARPVELSVQHAMASTAIPILFPSVQVGDFCFSDGALKQNTPIQPAIRMGADKMLVIGLDQAPAESFRRARLGCRMNPTPGLLFLLGRTINVLLSEALDYELSRMEMFNNLATRGAEMYGDDFLTNLNQLTGTIRKGRYRVIENLLIRPSVAPNDLAVEAARQSPDELRMPGASGKVFQRLALSETVMESELLSYLMFTPTYIRKLMDLGYEDARRQKDELMEFFQA